MQQTYRTVSVRTGTDASAEIRTITVQLVATGSTRTVALYYL